MMPLLMEAEVDLCVRSGSGSSSVATCGGAWHITPHMSHNNDTYQASPSITPHMPHTALCAHASYMTQSSPAGAHAPRAPPDP